MPEEQFDVVDATDRVIAVAARSVVHAQGLRHRAVSVLVTDRRGHLLIQRRAASKDEYPGRWSPSASGHVTAGETYDETAPRELLEEVGIATELSRVHRFDASRETAMEFTAVYVGRSDAPAHPDTAEVSEVRRIAPHALEEWMQREPDAFTPPFRLVFDWWLHSADRPRTPADD